MNRKWTVFGLAAGVLVTLSAASLSTADDKKHGELEEIMEKVQKHSGVLKKGTRTPVAYKKAQKDIETSALELAKIAKKIKPMKGALNKAKDEANPAAKWEEFSEHLFKASEAMAKVVAKADSTQADAKKALAPVSKSCADCHAVFKVEE